MPARLYVAIRELDGPPAMVARRGPRTLMVYDPRCNRLEISKAWTDLCTPDERLISALAYGLMYPLPEWTTSEGPALLYVPPTLRQHVCFRKPCLPGTRGCAPALQGGAELRRRSKANDMHLERAAYRAEMMKCTVDLTLVDALSQPTSVAS